MRTLKLLLVSPLAKMSLPAAYVKSPVGDAVLPLTLYSTETVESVGPVRAGAAILLKESELSVEILAGKIKELIGNPQQLRRMSESCARLAPKNAAGLVVSTMEKYTTHDARL